MATNESEFRIEQPRSVFGTWIAVVLLFCVVGLIVWVIMGAMPRGDNYEQKRAQARQEKLKTATEEFNKALHTYGWVDKEKGVVRVPIERGMELAVAELAQRKPAPANPIEGGAGEKAGMQVTAPTVPASAPAVTPQPGATPEAIAVEGPESTTRGSPAAVANPPDAAPGTQPGPDSTPAASPPPSSGQAPAPDAERAATPVQSAPGTPLPVPGRDPLTGPTPPPKQP